jgi:hypothetical protein
MYPPPQTSFFYDDTPPSSPLEVQLPTFEISPAREGDKEKKEHRKWLGHSEKTKKHPTPFSYEYVVTEGKLVGLAEFHPDNDYLHYSSSSRGSSRTPSRTQSSRSTPRTSRTFERRSGEGDRLMPPPPPPSPKKTTEKLKRALSLSNVKGRPNPEKKTKTPPMPTPPPVSPMDVPSPKHITEPFGPTPPLSPRRSFEEPRPAPQPPLRNMTGISTQITPPASPKQSSEVSTSIPKRTPSRLITKPLPPTVLNKEAVFEGPRRRPTIITTEVNPMVAQIEQASRPRPPLRRKTSKFIEHIDTAPPEDEKADASHPMPSLPPFDFGLPIISTSPLLAPLTSPLVDYPSWSRQSKPQSIQTSAQEDKPLHNRVVRMGSASNFRSTPTSVSVPPIALKRAATMRTRPPTHWGDVCMAEVKPVLMSPIIAAGHARMVSC